MDGIANSSLNHEESEGIELNDSEANVYVAVVSDLGKHVLASWCVIPLLLV